MFWWDKYTEYVRDHTADKPQPEVGQRWRCFADTIEILEVSPPLTRGEKTDVAIRFKVVEVHSPEDSSMVFDDDNPVDLFWGDVIDAYERVETLDIPDAGDDDDCCGWDRPSTDWTEILRREQTKMAQAMRGSVKMTMYEHASIVGLLVGLCVDKFDPNVPREKEILDLIEQFRNAWNAD